MPTIRRRTAASLAAVLGVSAVLLAGCSHPTPAPHVSDPTVPGASPSHDPARMPVDEKRTWRKGQPAALFECVHDADPSSSGRMTVSVPADPGDPKVQAAERLRRAAGAAPVFYVLAVVDTRGTGSDGSALGGPAFELETGRQADPAAGQRLLDGWAARVGERGRQDHRAAGPEAAGTNGLTRVLVVLDKAPDQVRNLRAAASSTPCVRV